MFGVQHRSFKHGSARLLCEFVRDDFVSIAKESRREKKMKAPSSLLPRCVMLGECPVLTSPTLEKVARAAQKELPPEAVFLRRSACRGLAAESNVLGRSLPPMQAMLQFVPQLVLEAAVQALQLITKSRAQTDQKPETSAELLPQFPIEGPS